MEAPKLTKLGGSLLVPSVQELAKQSLAEVPARYIRSDRNTAVKSMKDQSLHVIDLQKVLSPEPIIGELELERLHSACKRWGFFQVVNHGVDNLLIDKVKTDTEDFFKLPMDEKKIFWQEERDIERFGQAFVHSKNQKLDWADMFYMTTLPKHTRKPRLFPKLPLPLRDTIESYLSQSSKLSLTVIKSMEEALQMKTNVMADFFEDGIQQIRINYYPPCPQPEHVIRLTPHSDPGGLTILLQLNEVHGLQGVPNAFVVNVGDSLEERLTIATFNNLRADREIGPIPDTITPETPALFRTTGYEDYFEKFFCRKLEGKSFLDSLRIREGDEGTKIVQVD
ncbi:hypothetical protein C5167_017971 [Papaver somniferum]|uniref:Fe2OG dioxygenase domain-containing protein n=1 Tax=Papaver somniferum TaxID=3469 RepID=A0A4Y7IKW1_PAPSO|nr:hypothetical protein C5167_017971 [Papaver somniferum]